MTITAPATAETSLRLQPISGWGRFPVEPCQVVRPASQSALEAAVAQCGTTLLARGAGRSYGDTALNRDGTLVEMAGLDRYLDFDPASGLLCCEAGVTFAELVDTFLPRGYFLPVTPGTQHVTVGGAIANDVHGKNHHRDGSFGQFVLDFELLLPSGETIVCSRDQHAEIFWATIGGIGLTGIIRRARFYLKRIETAFVHVDYTKTRDLDETLEHFMASDARYQYSVSWIDCLARGKSLGRSVLMQGNPAKAGDLPVGAEPFARPSRPRLTVPFDAPAGLLNPLSLSLFNSAFYHKHRTVSGQLTAMEPYFYPLDAIAHWNRGYGPRGFLQYQVALPDATGRAGLMALLERLSAARTASFLAVLKRFGPGNAGLLSFPFEGYTLALDIPYAEGLVPFLQDLDRVVLAHGGRVYLAKDSVLTPGTFAAMYPQASRFKEIKRALDPQGRLSSSMARRLGL